MSQVADEELLSILEPRWKDRVVRAPAKVPPLTFAAVFIALAAMLRGGLLFYPGRMGDWGVLFLAVFLGAAIWALWPWGRGGRRWCVLAGTLCAAAVALQWSVLTDHRIVGVQASWVMRRVPKPVALVDALQLAAESALLLIGAVYVRRALQRSLLRAVAVAGMGAAHICLAMAAFSMFVRAAHQYGASAPGADGHCWTFQALLLITLAIGCVLVACLAVLSPQLLGPRVQSPVLPASRAALCEDTACTRCGYNLRTRCRIDVCPECAMPVEASLIDRRRFVGLRRGRLAAGCALLALVAVGGGGALRLCSATHLELFHVALEAWVLLAMCVGLLVATIVLAMGVNDLWPFVVACVAIALAALLLATQGCVMIHLLSQRYWVDEQLGIQALLAYALAADLALLMEIIARRGRVHIGGAMLIWLGIAACCSAPEGMWLIDGMSWSSAEFRWMVSTLSHMFRYHNEESLFLAIAVPVGTYWTTAALFLFTAGERPRRAAQTEAAGGNPRPLA